MFRFFRGFGGGAFWGEAVGCGDRSARVGRDRFLVFSGFSGEVPVGGAIKRTRFFRLWRRIGCGDRRLRVRRDRFLVFLGFRGAGASQQWDKTNPILPAMEGNRLGRIDGPGPTGTDFLFFGISGGRACWGEGLVSGIVELGSDVTDVSFFSGFRGRCLLGRGRRLR